MSSKISIVTVVYDDPDGLRKTLESIRVQTKQPYEWIVIDGNSPSRMRLALNAASQYGAIVVSERDDGIYDAMNKGLLLATGDYVQFLNAGDEFFNSESLVLVEEMISRTPLKDLYFMSAEVRISNTIAYSRAPREFSASVFHGLPAIHQATFYKREAFQPVLYDSTYKVCGDYYSVAKLYVSGATSASCSTVVVKFYAGGTSTRNFFVLINEPLRVQREVLRMGIFRRAMSAIRRVFAVSVYQLLYRASS